MTLRYRMTKLEFAKKFAQSIGLSSLILVMNYGDLLGGGSDVRMHVPFPLVGICLAQMADIVILAILIFVGLVALKQTRYYPIVRLALAISVPWYLVERLRAEIPFDVTGTLIVCMIVWGVVLVTLLRKFPHWYRFAIRGGNAVGVFFAVFAIVSFLQLGFVMRWKPGPYQNHAAWATTPQPPRHHPKVVWIIFDELSYDQVFGHRAKDLSLPNFDALRSQSTLFTNTQPIGVKTVKIVPSLLIGHTVDDYHFSFRNRMWVHNLGEGESHPITGQDTIFGDAKKQGWRTSAVGWYNPYCTIYGDSIDDCYWMNLDRIDGNMSQLASFWSNTYEPLKQVVREVKAPSRADRDTCTYDVRQRLKTAIDLQQHTYSMLRDDQSDFVFLHMPIPHSPNIWSRIEDNYTTFCDSSYLDNLALADKVLGRMMQILRASPRWDDTTVIVEGDHSWRTWIWQNLPAWTDEDDAEARHGFDPHPAMIIHQPGQTTPLTNDRPWSILNVHEVLEQTVKGQPVTY
jgi:hypothetical protein